MKLTLGDITDLRAYEREREEFRTRVIALKKRRRVGVGPFVTVLFENRDTVRFQIQEMARAEKILTDEAIQAELDIYNPLVPDPGTLCATLFIELTAGDDLRRWLPRLVGIERAVELRLADGSKVRSTPDEQHDAQLTREAITASVHYLRFELAAAQVETFAGGVRLASAHPNYAYETELGQSTTAELLADLRGG
jgi:hypothetical protein